MDEKTLSKAIYPMVALSFFLIPYTFIASFFLGVPLALQIKAEVYLLICGSALFFIDMFLQTFLAQDPIFKFLYIILIGALLGLIYSFVLPAFFLLLNDRTDLTWQIISFVQTYILLYFIYSGFKGFFVVIWDLDLV